MIDVEGLVQGDLQSFLDSCLSSKLAQLKVELVGDGLTPLSVFHSLVKVDEPGFILESVEQGERWSRYSFIGRKPLAIVAKNISGEVSVKGVGLPSPTNSPGLLQYLELLVETYSSKESSFPFDSGLVGYLAYDIVREVEPVLGKGKVSSSGTYDGYLYLVGEIAVFDHWRQTITLVKNILVPESVSIEDAKGLYYEAVQGLKDMANNLNTSSLPLVGAHKTEKLSTDLGRRSVGGDEFQWWVQTAKEKILEGEIFQVVLSQRFGFHLEVSPLALYRALRLLNPSPYMYLFQGEDHYVIGSSPEALVRIDGSRVVTRPIAGTRARGDSEEADRALGAELLEHPKEIAEHVMLVDLARNDIGKISSFGSVKVDEFMVLEKFSHVMHLSSEVSGDLRSEVSSIDVLRATMPAGTLSGAPKVRAMQIIEELEPIRRGLYGGIFGYIGFNGNLDVAIAIRTAVVDKNGNGWVQSGAGVVADSDPASEDTECVNKAKALLSAVQIANELFREDIG
ncbi:anthranilate synthase component 1 [Ferrithrix thermotolerans DSM 19514]|uniref:Anthranilate synthase component 1 n=1 Tax=Ferrithrix thermotolerans DSM 19514 TaxID=1121881 RepID=A0A1M4W2N6_9ACTN|nr:chorismate-binding protein [Ferrithrix thermotolerans]SHE75476.1 anthranilate synthase component 1 [Ferrithrix thermotolerans DSM 19514]